ncbi:adenosylmethionine--8-amino-7-oxononanoate transaminase [Alienimonas californiensis]|uniref:Adenosylmethionine-8-amino-7-oxononanoate aminotransferase n=1 Tax=Alienimonas californiensis TaxID=2527989 RepID=A0A517P4L9_9PLAN|nr:adenosylmethionine--8-amino-7-oxononanoate transaminase [Alienimonas californiensis]QDT14338.1 L-Lysine-8-amino-7-oxononanoate aminotransferase [Alienimonas californiensis]
MTDSPLWHPFTPMQAFAEERAPVIAAADGFELIDVAGKRYLDGVSSLWCNVHGHRVPEIDEAIRAQLDRVAHSTLLGLRCDVADELARQLVRIAPAAAGTEPLTKVFFSDSGATCVEVGLKMAFQYHRQKATPERRDLFLKLSHAYHGDTVGTASVGGISLFHTLYGELFYKTAAIPSPTPPGYPYALPEGHDADSLPRWALAETDRLLGEHAGRVAALVMEPRVQGAGGLLMHPAGYLRSIRELCTKHDVPLIADEVAVGFGKTGETWACQTEDVVPDFLCTAKGLTGGYLPVAATLTTDRIYDAFLGEPHELRTFFHGHTFTGNALGCAAALASLKKYEADDCPANARALSEAIGERLAPLADHPHVAAVRRCGVMTAIDLVAERVPHRPFPPERRTGHRAVLAARERGLILRPLGDTLVLMPAVGMPVGLADRLCETAIAAIDAATAA